MTDPELRAAINEAARAGAKEALRDIGCTTTRQAATYVTYGI